MSRRYKFLDQQLPYFVSFATVHWIDVFTRSVYSDLIVDSLRHCQAKKDLLLYAWCIMPNHMHLVMGTKGFPMQNILRDFKSYTSRVIKEEIRTHPKESRRKWLLWMFEQAGKRNGNNKNWQLWQQHNHPIEIYSNKVMEQKINYLHFNPVVAGYVERPEHWLYSSARNYYGKSGLLDIVEWI